MLIENTTVRQRAFASRIRCLPRVAFLIRKKVDVGIFLGLVVIAQAKHPVPSRTRKLSAAAPMVLGLKPRESRSPPNLVKSPISLNDQKIKKRPQKITQAERQ